MKDFYFTYGTSSLFPFQGGWTRVTAPTLKIACRVFNAIHETNEVFLNCCDYYTAEAFKKSKMYKDGNLGAKEHEHIYVSIETNEK